LFNDKGKPADVGSREDTVDVGAVKGFTLHAYF